MFYQLVDNARVMNDRSLVLPVPSATLCSVFYFFWNRKETQRKKASLDEEDG